MNLCKNDYVRWNEEDVQYLIENFKDYTYKEIAKHLGRTERSIITKMFNLRRDFREQQNS